MPTASQLAHGRAPAHLQLKPFAAEREIEPELRRVHLEINGAVAQRVRVLELALECVVQQRVPEGVAEQRGEEEVRS